MQLLPCDLRMLERYYTSQRSGLIALLNLQRWTMAIMATRLFLRYDEYHRIKVSDFLEPLFMVLPERICSLALEVSGKRDKGVKRQLRLYADSEYPELCPVIPLLIYMHLAGIKGGFLFPTVRELAKEPPSNGIFETHVDYEKELKKTQHDVKAVLPARKNMKVGCHIYRKSGYCHAIFGNANASDLQRGARHGTEKNARRYRVDAEAHHQMQLENPNPENMVSQWKSILIESPGNAELMTRMGGGLIVSFPELPTIFVRQYLGVAENDPFARDPVYLLGLAKQKAKSQKSVADEIEEFVADLHPDRAQRLRNIVGRACQQHAEALLDAQRDAHERSMDVVSAVAQENAARLAALESQTSTTNSAPVAMSKKRQRDEESEDDLDERKKLRSMKTTKEKVMLMKSIHEKKPNWGKLSSGARTFCSRYLTPVMCCLTDHFDGDIDRFCSTWGTNFSHTTFGEKCCSGRENVCKPNPSKAGER